MGDSTVYRKPGVIRHPQKPTKPATIVILVPKDTEVKIVKQ